MCRLSFSLTNALTVRIDYVTIKRYLLKKYGVRKIRKVASEFVLRAPRVAPNAREIGRGISTIDRVPLKSVKIKGCFPQHGVVVDARDTRRAVHRAKSLA